MLHHRSSATPLAWLCVAVIVYASLYPFTGWRAVGGSPWAFLVAPWSRWWTVFDLVSNLLGYMPLGALVFGARVRRGGSVTSALAWAAVTGSGLSLCMEFLQNFLPQRVSSNVDLGLNSAGAVLGSLAGLWVHRVGGVERWQAARDRWFIRRSAGGLALLLLWPTGLLVPLPAPLGQGQVGPRLQESLGQWLGGTPAAEWLQDWLDVAAVPEPLSGVGESALVALGLLAPCLVAFSVARPGWRRLLLVAGAAAVGALVTTLSTALNFGPQHLWAWATPNALLAFGVGAAAAALLSVASSRVAAALGLMALTALIILVTQAPTSPYFADSLQAWEQGRFIRFHGAARWVGWLWPYAAVTYLLARLGRSEDDPRIGA